MRRRELTLALAGAMAAAPFGSACGQASDDAALDGVLDELEVIQGQNLTAVGKGVDAIAARSSLNMDGTDAGFVVPALTPELVADLGARKYWDIPAATRLQPQWAAHAADYEHLSRFHIPSNAFELSAQTLLSLAERNSFQLTDRRPVLVFGLRGCRIASGDDWSPWALTHNLEAIEPTHLESRCVVGVLRKEDGMIAVFRASTVPAVDAVYTSLGVKGAGTSILPTGLYAYRVGNHRAAYPTRIQRGALLVAGQYCVLRSADDLTFDPYSAGDVWTRGANHNIHAAGNSLQRYQSNGCQVIRGVYTGADRMSATGAWSDFRRAANLVDAEGLPVAPEDAATYQYMLLTGREAAIAYHLSGRRVFDRGYHRLRPGSRGDAVRELQRERFARFPVAFEGKTADGVFGMATAFAELMYKKDTVGEYVSPIAVP